MDFFGTMMNERSMDRSLMDTVAHTLRLLLVSSTMLVKDGDNNDDDGDGSQTTTTPRVTAR
jgi:hypothetical protein